MLIAQQNESLQLKKKSLQFLKSGVKGKWNEYKWYLNI